ncbi:hypothetical protein [Amycolatopsis australiensis]|uniref:hypothetical protein n=1 Tax=Amycolatopsis australiensis TaxID=546364 RepID=UPI001161108F|nr:hypothetical protein [Amycolatopsis australiensis]
MTKSEGRAALYDLPAVRRRSPASRSLRSLCIAITAASLLTSITAARVAQPAVFHRILEGFPAWITVVLKAVSIGVLVFPVVAWVCYVPACRQYDADYYRRVAARRSAMTDVE